MAALTEEDHSSLRGAELDAFLADAASLQDNYDAMLKTLEETPAPVWYAIGSERQPSKTKLSDLFPSSATLAS